MKKLFLIMLALSVLGGANAQTILEEGFETGNTGETLTPVASGAGWTVINGYKGENAKYNWHNYYSPAESETGATITGNCCASVDAPFVYGEGEGVGPREEILLTPELDLNDTYQLQFTFRVSPVNAYENQRYDIQIRVVENGNLAGAETIFSIQNEKMLRDAGITVFPISNWNQYTARVDLSEFKGEKVKLAFVYKMYQETANVLWLDDVSVKKVVAPTGPQASVSLDRFDFGQLYVGEKKYTDVITLTNTGKDGLKITGVDLPEGVAINIDTEKVDLDRYQQVDFQLSYTASLKSPASANAVIHTNGGDVTIALSASKQFVPAGSMLENFEGYFPPAGWQANGWSQTKTAIEGDQSVYCGGGFSVCTLTSPRLDLFDGGTLSFTYYNAHDDEDYPEYDITLQVSYDGGNTWVTKWTSDYENGLNQLLTQSVNLGFGDENCYVRWVYPMVESDDEGAYPHSTFYLDRVVLPNVYGMDGVPGKTTLVSPANNAENVYPKDLKLEWGPAQFADGYKLYVGTSRDANELINGIDLGNALTYTIPACDYETTYIWKVVGYNSKGDCASPSSWRFTTQRDASVSAYPYIENFEKGQLPEGWVNSPSANYARTWNVNTLKPYTNNGVTYNVLHTIWLQTGDSNWVGTQEFQLPDDKSMSISYIWGDEHPASLVADPTETVKKNNVDPNNGISETFFEINAGNGWETLSNISENYFDEDKKHWINEKVDLAAYKGKKVQFRWRHVSYSGKDNGGSITHIVLEENNDQNAIFNKSGWEAGKVNYLKAAKTSEVYTVVNKGSAPLKVKTAAFGTPYFATSIAEGDEIPADGSLTFDMTFNALDCNRQVDDVLTVIFESGYKMTLPVSGTGLDEHTRYYSFEPNDLDHSWENDFTMIDVDKGINFNFGSYWVHYSAGGQKSAFTAENDSKEDGMYGMMSPVSGNWALVAASPANGAADNWIIFRKFNASTDSKFDFYARNLETANSVLPDPKHHVEVLVSTEGNTSTSDFKTVMRDTEMPHLDEGQWNHYEVELGQYAGQNIHVAVRHTTASASNVAFFDDFTFSNIDKGSEGVECVDSVSADAIVKVYGFDGQLVAEGPASMLNTLARGLYIVRINDGGELKTIKVKI